MQMHCLQCDKISELSRCSRCKFASFCGKECQRLAWPRHKLVCSPLLCSLDNPSSGEVVSIGNYELKWGLDLGEMLDSSADIAHPSRLRQTIATNGYALLRGVLPVEKILAARSVVVETLKNEWNMVDSSVPLLEARILDAHKGMLLTGFRKVTHNPVVLDLLEGTELSELFRSLFGQEPATFDNKWVRVMGQGEGTDEHTDYYRFASTANQMVTCWIPLGDYSIFQGTLAICEKSHLLEGYHQNHESKSEMPPAFDEFQRSAIWRSTRFKPGDVVVFDIRTVHASSKNQSQQFRLSMDTRWQPSATLSTDMRSCFRSFPREG